MWPPAADRSSRQGQWVQDQIPGQPRLNNYVQSRSHIKKKYNKKTEPGTLAVLSTLLVTNDRKLDPNSSGKRVDFFGSRSQTTVPGNGYCDRPTWVRTHPSTKDSGQRDMVLSFRSNGCRGTGGGKQHEPAPVSSAAPPRCKLT